MTGSTEQRLAELGIRLPDTAAPAANYVPYRRTGKTVFISGQLPFLDGKLVATGKLGGGITVEEGRKAARACALNLLAHLRDAAGGDLDKVAAIIKISVFVASAPGFTEQHIVANGASDVLVEILGDRGTHARAAVGMAALPLDAAVEVEAIVELA